MRKKTIGFALSAMLLTLGFPADAQQAGKVPRVAYLSLRPGPSPNIEAFEQGLRDLGYVEGRNIAVEYRDAGGNPDRFPALSAELVRLKVDVIVTASTPAVLALKNATGTIPIVFAAASDPIASRLVSSLMRPGGNVTGLSSVSPEVGRKRLAFFKETFSKISRVGVLWDPTSGLNAVEWTETEVAARALGVELLSLEVRRANDFPPAFDSAIRKRTGGPIVLRNPLSDNLRQRVADLAVKSRMPAIYNDRGFVEAGGLMSYGPDLADLYRRAAFYVDKILKGARPADLPVEEPTKFELVINLNTAKQIGVTIPPEVLMRADKLIK